MRAMLNALTILPFSQHSVEIFADVKALLHRNGNIIQDFDIAIASIALEHQLTLVTNNERDFRRIRGLKIENWTV